MKKCSYCGKEYPEETMECVVDGTALVADVPRTAEVPNSSRISLGPVAAIGSLISVPTAVAICALSLRFPPGRSEESDFVAFNFAVLLSIVLLIAGLLLGIVALVKTRRRIQPAQFGIAVAGTCLNALLLLFVLIGPPLLQAGIAATHQRKVAEPEFEAALRKLAAASSDEQKFYAFGNAAISVRLSTSRI